MKRFLIYLLSAAFLTGNICITALAADDANSDKDVKTEAVKVYKESKEAIVQDIKTMKEEIPKGLKEAKESAIQQSRDVKDSAVKEFKEIKENVTHPKLTPKTDNK